MTTTTRPAPLHALATIIGGTVTDDDMIGHLSAGARVYVAFTGNVRLERPGLPVLTLGTWSDTPEQLGSAYFAATAAVAS